MEGRFSEELVIEYWAHGRFLGDGSGRTGFRNEVLEYLRHTLKIKKNSTVIYEILEAVFEAGRAYAHEFSVEKNGEGLRRFLIAIASLNAWTLASDAKFSSSWERICAVLSTEERELVTRHCWLKDIQGSIKSVAEEMIKSNASFNEFYYSTIFGNLECEIEKLKEGVASDPEYGRVREKIRAEIENLLK